MNLINNKRFGLFFNSVYKGKCVILFSLSNVFNKTNSVVFFFGLNKNFLFVNEFNKEFFCFDLAVKYYKYGVMLFFLKNFSKKFFLEGFFNCFNLYNFYLEFFSVDFFCKVFFNKLLFNKNKLSNEFFFFKTNSQLVFPKDFLKYSNIILNSNFIKTKLVFFFCFYLIFFKYHFLFVLKLFQQNFYFKFL